MQANNQTWTYYTPYINVNYGMEKTPPQILNYNDTTPGTEPAQSWAITRLVKAAVNTGRAILITPAATRTLIPSSHASDNAKHTAGVKKQNFLRANYNNREFNLVNSKGQTINGITFHSSGYEASRFGEEFNPLDGQKWIIMFNGNGELYENKLEIAQTYFNDVSKKQEDVHLLAFNYTGVNESSGYPTYSSEVIENASSVINYLIQRGVNPEDIVLYNHSIGGGVGSEVVKNLEKINVIDTNTFSTLADTAKELIGTSVASGFVQAAYWNLNTFEAVEQILEKGGRVLAINHASDAIVKYPSALSKALICAHIDEFRSFDETEDRKEYRTAGKLPALQVVEVHGMTNAYAAEFRTNKRVADSLVNFFYEKEISSSEYNRQKFVRDSFYYDLIDCFNKHADAFGKLDFETLKELKGKAEYTEKYNEIIEPFIRDLLSSIKALSDKNELAFDENGVRGVVGKWLNPIIEEILANQFDVHNLNPINEKVTWQRIIDFTVECFKPKLCP